MTICFRWANLSIVLYIYIISHDLESAPACMCAAQAPMRNCISCMSQQGLLATYLVLGRDGRGSGWDLRVRPALAPAVPAASGNLGIWGSGNVDFKKSRK